MRTLNILVALVGAYDHVVLHDPDVNGGDGILWPLDAPHGPRDARGGHPPLPSHTGCMGSSFRIILFKSFYIK